MANNSFKLHDIVDKGDLLLENLKIKYAGKATFFKHIIINKNGVFFVNTEESDEQSEKDIAMQNFILSKLLKEHKFPSWTEGFVISDKNNSSKSSKIISEKEELDDAIHNGVNQNISDECKERIYKYLSLFHHDN